MIFVIHFLKLGKNVYSKPILQIIYKINQDSKLMKISITKCFTMIRRIMGYFINGVFNY